MRTTVKIESDEELVARLAARRDEAALERLLERHWGGAYRVALRIGGDPGLAEDAAQEAFIALVEAAQGFEPGRSFRPWFLRIARNAALNAVRARGRRAHHEQAALKPPGNVELARLDQRDAVERVLACLGETYRRTVQLHFLDGFTQREVAELLETSEGTIASRIHRALRQLQEQLAPAHALAVSPLGLLLSSLGEREAIPAAPAAAELVAVAGAAGAAAPAAAREAILAAAKPRGRRLVPFALLALALVAGALGVIARSGGGERGVEAAGAAAPGSEARGPRNGPQPPSGTAPERSGGAPHAPGGPAEDAPPASAPAASLPGTTTPAPVQTHLLPVRVVHRGVPVPGAVVWLGESRHQPAWESAPTDGDGRTLLEVAAGTQHLVRLARGPHKGVIFQARLIAGEARIAPSQEGTFWGDADSGESGYLAEMPAGTPPGVELYHELDASAEHVSLRLAPTAVTPSLELELFELRVSGRVVDDATGAPLQGVRLRLKNPWDAAFHEGEAQSDALGQFSLVQLGVGMGTELLGEGPAGYAPVEIRVLEWREEEQEEEASDGVLESHGLELRLAAALVLRGRLLDPAGAPLAGQKVSVWSRAPAHKAGTNSEVVHRLPVTDGEGRFEATLIPGGGRHGPTTSDATVEFRPALVDLKWPHFVQRVVVGPGTPEQVFRLSEGLALRGRVVDGDGRPVKEAYLCVPHDDRHTAFGSVRAYARHGEPEPWWKDLSDPDRGVISFRFHDGHLRRTRGEEATFALGWMPAGRHRLLVGAPGYARRELPVDLPQAEPLVVVLEPARAIRGRVLSPDGAPAPRMLVRAFPCGVGAEPDEWSMSGAPARSADRTGEFELRELPAGRFDLLAIPLDPNDGTSYQGRIVARDVEAGSVDVSLQDAAQGLIGFELPKGEVGQQERVRVEVWDAQGRRLHRLDTWPGTCRLQVPAGDVWVGVAAAGAPLSAQRVRVNPAHTTELGLLAPERGGAAIELALECAGPLESLQVEHTDPRSGQRLVREVGLDGPRRVILERIPSWPGEVELRVRWRALGAAEDSVVPALRVVVEEGKTAQARVALR